MNASQEIVSAASPDPQERRRTYNRVVREAHLVTILLSEVNFKVRRNVERPSEENRANISYGGKVVSFSYDDGRGACAVGVQWLVEIRVGKKRFARCIVHYDIIYDGFTDCDQEIVKLFAENVAQPAT